jgi:hypothetical protein
VKQISSGNILWSSIYFNTLATDSISFWDPNNLINWLQRTNFKDNLFGNLLARASIALATNVFPVLVQAINNLIRELLLGIKEYRINSFQFVNNRLYSFALSHAEMRESITWTSGWNFWTRIWYTLKAVSSFFSFPQIEIKDKAWILFGEFLNADKESSKVST